MFLHGNSAVFDIFVLGRGQRSWLIGEIRGILTGQIDTGSSFFEHSASICEHHLVRSCLVLPVARGSRSLSSTCCSSLSSSNGVGRCCALESLRECLDCSSIVHSLGHELSDVLSRRRTSEEALGQTLGDRASIIQELMGKDLVETWSDLGVADEDLGDEVLGCVGDDDVLGEAVGVHSDAAIGGFHVGGLEGRLPDYQRVDYHSERPDVYLVGMT